jgi:hypothetical protein
MRNLMIAAAALAVSCGAQEKTTFSLSASVAGVASAGVILTLTGAVTRSATLDASGKFVFVDLPDGDYTLTPSMGDLTFLPPAVVFSGLAGPDQTANFLSTPHSQPLTTTVTGDAASGIAGGTYTPPALPSAANRVAGTPVNSNILLSSGGADPWIFTFLTGAESGREGNGFVSFAGPPAARSYSNATPGLVESGATCWQVSRPLTMSGQLQDEFWSGGDFTVTFDSVTAVPARAGDSSLLTDYVVHGTFHMDCPPVTDFGVAQGHVAVDITF